MAGRHWLDPLARRLLVAAGQLPPPPRVAPIALAGQADETVERELLALKLAQNPKLRLRDAAEVHHAAALGWTLEVNVAATGDWLRLPGCRPDQVDRLIRLRRDGVQWSGPGGWPGRCRFPLNRCWSGCRCFVLPGTGSPGLPRYRFPWRSTRPRKACCGSVSAWVRSAAGCF